MKIAISCLGRMDDTKTELWMVKRETGHWYEASADFAHKGLGRGPGRCLVIGSPLFEALELIQDRWRVTYVDVRSPPENYRRMFDFMQGDASEIKLPENFDSASSSCVLCHAGMGRYGDKVTEGADLKIMKNIHRSLKKGGKAAITVGCVAEVQETLEIGTGWRVWNLEGARVLMKDF